MIDLSSVVTETVVAALVTGAAGAIGVWLKMRADLARSRADTITARAEVEQAKAAAAPGIQEAIARQTEVLLVYYKQAVEAAAARERDLVERVTQMDAKIEAQSDKIEAQSAEIEALTAHVVELRDLLTSHNITLPPPPKARTPKRRTSVDPAPVAS